MNFEDFLNEAKFDYTDYKEWQKAAKKIDPSVDFKKGGTEDEIVALSSKGNRAQQIGKWIGTEKSGKGKIYSK